MPPLKLIFVGSLAVFLGMTAFEAVTKPSTSSFVAVPAPNEVDPVQVTVFGSLTCPQSGPQTQALIDQLSQANVPYKHASSLSISDVNDANDWYGVNQLNEIMKRGAPIVFVAGKAKAQPTATEVITEYKNSRRR